MVDMIKGIIDYDSTREVESVLEGLTEYYPEARRDPRTGEVKYHADIRGLRVVIRPGNRSINFINSLPKFIQGNNYENLTYNSLRAGIARLCEVFQCSPEIIYPTQFEVGYNLIVSDLPVKYLKAWISHNSKSFYPLPPNSKRSPEPIEYYCAKSQYVIKGYDAGRWNGLDPKENRLKFELRFKSMQKVYELLGSSRKSQRLNLGFFTDAPFLATMNEFIEKTYLSIQKKPCYEASFLSSKDRQLLFAAQSSEYWQLEKENSRDYHKKIRSRYNKLLKTLPENDLDLTPFLKAESIRFFQN